MAERVLDRQFVDFLGIVHSVGGGRGRVFGIGYGVRRFAAEVKSAARSTRAPKIRYSSFQVPEYDSLPGRFLITSNGQI